MTSTWGLLRRALSGGKSVNSIHPSEAMFPLKHSFCSQFRLQGNFEFHRTVGTKLVHAHFVPFFMHRDASVGCVTPVRIRGALREAFKAEMCSAKKGISGS